MSDFIVPKKLPATGPMIDFFKEHGIDAPKNTKWPEIFKILDDKFLWADVGPTLRKLGLVHPFDPGTIPEEVKNVLGLFKYYGSESELKVQECAKISDLLINKHDDFFESLKKITCIFTRGDLNLKDEFTAEESFNRCLNSEDPGTCSEVAYRLAASLLYMHSTCAIKVFKWPYHIEISPGDYLSDRVEDSKLSMGPPSSTGNLSNLFFSYYFDLSIKMDKKGERKKATEILSFVRKLSPDNIRGKLLQAGYWFQDGQLNKAEKLLEEVVSSDSYNALASAKLSSINLTEGDFEKAYSNALKAIYRDPWANEGYYALFSYNYEMWGRLDMDVLRRIERLTDKEISDQKEDFDAFQKKVEEYYSLFENVVDEMDFILNPDLDAMQQVALIYYNFNEFDKAEEILEMARDIDPSDGLTLNLLNTIMFRQGRYFDVETLSRKFLDKNPLSEVASRDLGVALMTQKKYGEAERLYRGLLSFCREKTLPDAHFGLAHAMIGTDYSNTEIIRELDEAIKLSPDLAEAYLLLGSVLTYAGYADEAFKALDKARQIDPMYSNAYIRLAEYYINQDDLRSGAMWYTLAEKIEGDDFDRFDIPAHVMLENDSFKDYKLAENMFRKSLDKWPENTNALSGMVIALYEQGKDEYRYYLKELKLSGDNGSLFHAMGRISEKDGNRERAIDYYKKAIAISPGFGLVLRRLKKLGVSPQARELNFFDTITDDDPHLADFAHSVSRELITKIKVY